MDDREYPSLIQVVSIEASILEPKMFGKKQQNGVSTPHVLSMRPYAQIRAKHAKKGHLVKICPFTLLKV